MIAPNHLDPRKVIGEKAKTAQEYQDDIWYLFWRHGFTFKDLENMPMPYAISIMEKHKEYLDKQEKLQKKR